MAIVGAIAVPHPPLIVPAVGRGEERRIHETIDAYERAVDGLLASEPDCLVVTSPHAPSFRNGFHVTTDATLDGSMARFNAPREEIHAECDVALASEIMRRADAAGIAAVGSDRYRDDMDHGTYVPLYFVREAAGLDGMLPCPIVRIGLSGLSPAVHRELGHIIAQAADALGRRVGFIASGDLSHKLLPDGPYGFAPEGPVFDERIGDIFASGDLEGLFGFEEEFCEAAAECGLRSFQIMVGALDGIAVDCALLSNEGPFGVGYGVATCMPEGDGGRAGSLGQTGSPDESGPSNDDRSLDGSGSHEGEGPGSADGRGAVAEPLSHVGLARLSVETFVRTGRPATLPAGVAPELLNRRAGVFVSLHEHGELRGCIGTIEPTCSSIAVEIIQNGVSACSRDPRFDPVRPEELDYLEYSVDVLGETEPVASSDALDPARYGVIVTKGWKRGLLLPNLDGVDTVADQLAIAKRKAGIDPADEAVDIERFEVVRHTLGGEPRKR